MKRWLVAGLALALAAGCARRETQVAAGDRDQVLYRGNASEPESLDPYLVRGAVEWTIVGGLFEGLVTADMATLEPRPGVAERWEISADGLVYTFHLRANAAWSDGTPVTAGDFEYGARRLLAPRLGAAHAENNLFFVRGASDYQAGRIKDFAAVGVKARDPRTLEITLARPTPFFLSALILFFPVPQATVEKFAAMDERVNNWIRPGNLVGNGAFRLKAWRQNQGVVLERNPRYWDAARVRLKEIHFLPIENAQAEEAAFRTGQLHVTSAVPLNKLEVYAREQPEALKVVDDRGVYFYSLNVAKPPFDDRRVRLALSLAVDRERLTSQVIKGGKSPAWSFTPPGIGGYTARARVAFDPERARALLREAGFDGGRNFPAVELLVDAREHHRIVAEAVQEMWRQHLGITVKLRNEETQVLNSSKRQMDFQLVRGSWNATTYQDPFYFLGAWRSGALYNESKWSNAEFDRLIEATWTVDRAVREKAFQEAEEIFLRELPAIPLFFSTQTMLMSPSVKGWQPKPFADRRLKDLWLEK
ncbi:peptide ABC transporter substrate-binding protein [Horticoccus sp. 23ND18S-11]|uniref:peptide ABC transporter substrate-binding protein n=1 Tax=Horticoccus sp. 23ND18S-11 TaxID=3391832 RepID=UPI0039C92F8F